MTEHPLLERAKARVREHIQARVLSCGPVDDGAIESVIPVLEGMLADVSPGIVGTLARAGFSVVIIASELKITDAQPWLSWRGTSVDAWGGVCSIWKRCISMKPPMLAVLQNCLPGALVHEVAHLVMDLGLGRRDMSGCPTRFAIANAYRRALWEQKYTLEPLTYTLTNDQEYFACTSQAWFNVGWHKYTPHATTRAAIKAHDPRAAAVLEEIWGDDAWRPEGAHAPPPVRPPTPRPAPIPSRVPDARLPEQSMMKTSERAATAIFAIAVTAIFAVALGAPFAVNYVFDKFIVKGNVDEERRRSAATLAARGSSRPTFDVARFLKGGW